MPVLNSIFVMETIPANPHWLGTLGRQKPPHSRSDGVPFRVAFSRSVVSATPVMTRLGEAPDRDTHSKNLPFELDPAGLSDAGTDALAQGFEVGGSRVAAIDEKVAVQL